MRVLLSYLTILTVLISASFSSYAADSAQLRFSRNDGYERLVFEWSRVQAPSYQLTKTANSVEITFSSPVTFNVSQIKGADSDFVEGIDIKSSTMMRIELNDYDDLRDMRIGQKMILDVYGTSEQAEDKVEKDIQPAAGEQEHSAPAQEDHSESHKEDAHAEEDHDATQSLKEAVRANIPQKQTTKPEIDVAEAPKETVLETAVNTANEAEPVALILSSTEGIKLAAYERFGSLWMLANSVDIPIKPFLEGRNKEKFAALKEYKVADGTATLWQLPLPENYNVMGEGGSLYWRIVLSTNDLPNKIESVTPVKAEIEGRGVRSGSLLIQAQSDKRVLNIIDPLAGDQIAAVLVDSSEIYNDTVYEYADLTILESVIGLAFEVKTPELEINVDDTQVEISAPSGLALVRESDVSKSTAPPSDETSLFHFREWGMGPISALEENQQLLLNSMIGKSNAGQAERLLTLAKLNLAHGRGAEAKGFAEYAVSLMPELARSPSFLAIRGVAAHVASQHDLAIQDLANPALEKYSEINLWKSATLAHLGDWQQAIDTLPKNLEPLQHYPDVLSVPLTLALSEIGLRDGRIETGEALLAALAAKEDTVLGPHKYGGQYLKGEILRQNGEIEEATALWSKLAKEEDPLYRTKSELALVSLGRSENTLKPKDAVERLENLRFVWRGDDLEIQVLRRLGLSEIEAKKYINGFKTLRDTVVLSENNALSDQITQTMIETYEDLFLTDRIETVSPLDAAMLYEEFRELTPTGKKGDRLIARLAERLVDADLFERAVKLLAYQLDYRLKGEEAISTALRMASIQLMDRRPEDALTTLNKAQALLKKAEFPNKNLKQKDLGLLRARALSEVGDVQAALNLLENMVPPSRDISRLEADIAWKAGRWDEAADALRELVLEKEFSSEQEFNEADAQLLLNYAIALNLSDQRITLRNIRERHSGQMNMTPHGERFEVITRPRQNAMLSDRDTMQNMIGETEIFSDFLDTYKALETENN